MPPEPGGMQAYLRMDDILLTLLSARQWRQSIRHRFNTSRPIASYMTSCCHGYDRHSVHAVSKKIRIVILIPNIIDIDIDIAIISDLLLLLIITNHLN